MRFKDLAFLVLAAGMLATGCKGPIGATGPEGPSGTSSPTYLFTQDFDGSGYSPSSQFTVVDPNSAPGGLETSGSVFVSSPDSLLMVWDGNPGDEAGFYTSAGEFTVAANTTCYFDTFINLSLLATSGTEAELVFNVGGSTVADLGFLSQGSSSAQVYSYNNSAVVDLSSVSTSYYHHAILCWSPTTYLSSVTLDGELLAQNLVGKRSPQPSGAPSTSAGILYPLGAASGNDVYLDNFTVYHY